MKKLFLPFLMMLMATAAAWAQYVVIDGIRYSLSSDEASVEAPESGVYTGAVSIPATVSYDDNGQMRYDMTRAVTLTPTYDPDITPEPAPVSTLEPGEDISR